MSKSVLIRSIAMLSFAVSLAACNGPSTLRGKVSDQGGTQQQGLGADGFGGSGTVAAATSVRVMSVGSGGVLTPLATGQVDASGEYSVTLSGGDRLVVEAVDAQG